LAIDEEQVRALARLQMIEIAPGHMPGVIRNLETLLSQASLLTAPVIDAVVEPAPVFRP
jgi:Asp-tRNA(Asn)/Glu-tRNA(Gln) amidotransferase C subunit